MVALEASRIAQLLSYNVWAAGRLRPQGAPAYARTACACDSLLAAGRPVCLVTLNTTYSPLRLCKAGLVLVSNDDGKVWPKVFRFFPFAAIERQLQQPLIALLDAKNMLCLQILERRNGLVRLG